MTNQTFLLGKTKVQKNKFPSGISKILSYRDSTMRIMRITKNLFTNSPQKLTFRLYLVLPFLCLPYSLFFKRIGLFLYYISHLNCFVNMPFESTAYHIPSFSTKAITVGLIRISWAYLIIASPCP